MPPKTNRYPGARQNSVAMWVGGQGLCCHWGHGVIWSRAADEDCVWVCGPIAAKVCFDVHQKQCQCQGSGPLPVAMLVSTDPTTSGFRPVQVIYPAKWGWPWAMCGSVAQQPPGLGWCPLLLLPQGVIDTMRVDIQCPCWASPFLHWPQDSWPCPSLDTITEELVLPPPWES